MPSVPGIELRPLTVADAPACAELARSRGWAYELGRWTFLLGEGQGWGAVDADGAVVSTVVVCPATEDLATVGSLLVAQALQGKGLGRAMMTRALRQAGDRQVALFSTRSGRRLYDGLGFSEIGSLIMHRGRVRTPAGHVPMTQELASEDVGEIAAFDAQAYGGDRRVALAKVAGFWRRARVLRDGERVLGWAGAWESDGAHVIGPVIAVNDESALTVLADVLASCPGPVRVDVGEQRVSVRGWLSRRGLTPVGRTMQMALRGAELPGRAAWRYSPFMQSMM